AAKAVRWKRVLDDEVEAECPQAGADPFDDCAVGVREPPDSAAAAALGVEDPSEKAPRPLVAGLPRPGAHAADGSHRGTALGADRAVPRSNCLEAFIGDEAELGEVELGALQRLEIHGSEPELLAAVRVPADHAAQVSATVVRVLGRGGGKAPEA